MDETTPLLQSVNQSKRNNWIHSLQCKCLHSVKYRLPTITENGAIVVLVWNTLMCIALFCTVYNPLSTWTDAIVLTFPIAGHGRN